MGYWHWTNFCTSKTIIIIIIITKETLVIIVLLLFVGKEGLGFLNNLSKDVVTRYNGIV